jgi:hypothetical protein
LRDIQTRAIDGLCAQAHVYELATIFHCLRSFRKKRRAYKVTMKQPIPNPQGDIYARILRLSGKAYRVIKRNLITADIDE